MDTAQQPERRESPAMQALRKYGRHGVLGGPICQMMIHSERPCSCGLDAALEALDPVPAEVAKAMEFMDSMIPPMNYHPWGKLNAAWKVLRARVIDWAGPDSTGRKGGPRRWLITSQPDDGFAPALEGPAINFQEAKKGIWVLEEEAAGENNADARAEGYRDAMHRHVVREMVRWWPNGMAAFPGGAEQAKAFLGTWDIGNACVRKVEDLGREQLAGAYVGSLMAIGDLVRFVNVCNIMAPDRFGACHWCKRHLETHGHLETCELIRVVKAAQDFEKRTPKENQGDKNGF